METEVAQIPPDPMETFQAKVLDKVRESIAEMLPDEVVEGLVQRAIDEQFFQPIKVPRTYGAPDEEPSWFIKEVTRLSKPILSDYVRAHLKEREPEIKKAVEQFLSTQNLTLITIAAMQSAVRQDLYEFANMVVEKLRQP